MGTAIEQMAAEALPQHPRRGGGQVDRGRVGTAGGPSARMTMHRPAEAESDVRLTMPARPENLALVRNVIGALAEALSLPAPVVDDMRLAVTEACANVVRHAYAEERGSIDVVVRPRHESLEVVVADAGRGMGPSPDTRGPGLGLPLIAALADTFDIQARTPSGSRLVMSFRRDRTDSAMEAA